MVRRLFAVGALTAAFTLAATLSWAAPVTFDLNCGPLSNTACPSTGSYGTITISDNLGDSTKVDVTIDLTGVGQNKYMSLYLNLDSSLPTTGWSITSGGGSLTVGTDAQVLPPYNGGFDLNIFDPAQTEPHTYTLALTSQDLDPSDFNFKDTLGLLFAAMHVQACGPTTPNCSPGQSGTSSIKVGSLEVQTGSNDVQTGSNDVQTGSNDVQTGSNDVQTGSNDVTTGSNEVTVPGPAPVALIGLGLAGVAMWGRIRRR